jgi:hypothetical protein
MPKLQHRLPPKLVVSVVAGRGADPDRSTADEQVIR